MHAREIIDLCNDMSTIEHTVSTLDGPLFSRRMTSFEADESFNFESIESEEIASYLRILLSLKKCPDCLKTYL